MFMSVNESSQLFTYTATVWLGCEPRTSCSRRIDDEILERPVKDTDLLLLRSAHPVTREYFVLRRSYTKPLSIPRFSPARLTSVPAPSRSSHRWRQLVPIKKASGLIIGGFRVFRNCGFRVFRIWWPGGRIQPKPKTPWSDDEIPIFLFRVVESMSTAWPALPSNQAPRVGKQSVNLRRGGTAKECCYFFEMFGLSTFLRFWCPQDQYCHRSYG